MPIEKNRAKNAAPMEADELFMPGEARHEAKENAERWSDLPPEPSDPELAALREKLFKREIATINKLKFMLDSGQYNARAISQVVSEAIALSAAKDERLATALEPVVEGIVTESMRLHRDDFINALFPLMGPSIRKSIAENFRSMMGSLSKSLEVAFSWKGLRWRIQALRSGKPFSEVVMLNTLIYRVEQVFFIHSRTGLVLSHLVNEGVGSQDADMVSAMLTAIQDFVRDAFVGGAGSDLESLQMGEATILIEKRSEAYLACVVRGTPPPDIRERLQGVLDSLLLEYGPQLAAFRGDTTPFRHSIRFLEEFMISHYVDEDRGPPAWARKAPAVALALALLIFAACKWSASEREDSLNNAIGLLRAEPGIMVINVEKRSQSPWQVMALTDELARSPEAVLEDEAKSENLLKHLRFRLVPFVSYDPAIIEKRVRNEIALPEGVEMSLEDGVLSFTGSAPMRWILEARDRANSLAGIKHVNIEGLTDPRMSKILDLARQIESTTIEFPSGQAQPSATSKPRLAKAVDALVQLEKLATEIGLAVSLTIYGHADTTGSDQANYEISRARTQTLAVMLYARGSSIPIAMYAMGSQYPKSGDAPPNRPTPDQSSRRIEMRVHLLQSVQPLSARPPK